MIEWFRSLTATNKIAVAAVVVPTILTVAGGTITFLIKKEHAQTSIEGVYQNGAGNRAIVTEENKGTVVGGDLIVNDDGKDAIEELRDVSEEFGRLKEAYIVQKATISEESQSRHKLDQRSWLSPARLVISPIEVSDEDATTQWVGADGTKGEKIAIGKFGTVKVSIFVENTGKTPCYITQVITTSLIGDRNSVEEQIQKVLAIPPKAVESKTPIPPGQTVEFSDALVLVPVGSTIEDIESGEQHAVFVAKFVYKDVFGDSHLTQFCYRLFPSIRKGHTLRGYCKMD